MPDGTDEHWSNPQEGLEHYRDRTRELSEMNQRYVEILHRTQIAVRPSAVHSWGELPEAVEALRANERQLIEAIRLSVEYVGLDVLRPIAGWSWYDAWRAVDREGLEAWLDQMPESAGGRRPCSPPAPRLATTDAVQREA